MQAKCPADQRLRQKRKPYNNENKPHKKKKMNRKWREQMVLKILNLYEKKIREVQLKDIESCYDIIRAYGEELRRLETENKSRKWKRRAKIRSLTHKFEYANLRNYKEKIRKVRSRKDQEVEQGHIKNQTKKMTKTIMMKIMTKKLRKNLSGSPKINL